ncbi:MAG TPA: hypothetical protein VGE47_04560, partial [Burkholderiaceae bacterium]
GLRLFIQSRTLLKRASLVIGGTTGCRRALYYDLRLSGIVVEGPAAWRAGSQVNLSYVSREAEVKVDFRFKDGDLWPWNAYCPELARQ